MYINNPFKRKVYSIDYISSADLSNQITKSKTKLQREYKDIDDGTLYSKLSSEYSHTYLNVKGKLINIQFIEIQSNPLRFNSRLILKENDFDDSTHTIAINRIKEEMHQALIVIQYNTIFFLTNLLTEICQSTTNPLLSDTIFKVTPLSKIYYKGMKLFTPKSIKSRTILMQSPLSYNLLKKKKSKSMIIGTQDQLSIKQLISMKDIKELSYTELLCTPVDHIISKSTKKKDITSLVNTTKVIKHLMGRIITINNNSKREGYIQYSLILMSLIDCNTIIVYLGKEYPKFLNVNKIIRISNLAMKLSDKLCFIFYTIRSTVFNLIGDTSMIEMPLNDFSYPDTFKSLTPLSFLIESNQLIRHQIRFIAKIAVIYRITGNLIKRIVSFDDDIFKTITLKGKILLEDGSAEAMCYINDDVLVNTLGISTILLHQMAKIIQERDYVMLYNKYEKCYIEFDQLSKGLYNERYFIGRPFCIFNPYHDDIGIGNCNSQFSQSSFEDVNQFEYIKTNYIFVNGMLNYYCNHENNNKSLGIRPTIMIDYSERVIENYDVEAND